MFHLQILDPRREEWFTAVANVSETLARNIAGGFDLLIFWRVVPADSE